MLISLKFLLVLLQTLAWILLFFPGVGNSEFSVPAATTMLTAANIMKPGCPRKCGNLTIPYPFGIGQGCSMGDPYLITCNSSKALFGGTSEILDITETQLRIEKGAVASTCTISNARIDSTVEVDLTGQPYVYSYAENKFMVTGCHHYGLMEAETRAAERQVLS